MNRREFLSLDDPSTPPSDAGGAIPPASEFYRSSRGLDRYIPSPEQPWDYTRAAHLLRRAMIGPTDAEIRRAVEEGLDATIDRLLQPHVPSLKLIDEWAGSDPSISSAEPEGPVSVVWVEQKLARREKLGRWWLRTIVEAPVSLQERMTLFWHGHFVSEMRVVEYAEWMYQQNQLLRRNALGNFKELVGEITTDMAMLIYLNGVDNYIEPWGGSHINENHARELMELFTMGPVDWDGTANYTQRDVAEAARALSGWTRTPSPMGELYAGLRGSFRPERWDGGVKTFLGRSGAFGAQDIIEIIFSQRRGQIARFICGKLYRTFVYQEPDRAIIDGMAGTLLAHDWEIAPVMAELLASEHFYDPTNIGALARTVTDYHLSIVRGMGLGNVPDFDPATPSYPAGDLCARLLKLGQMPFYPPNVKGWPEGRAWVSASTLPGRQKFALDVAAGRITAGPGKPELYRFDPIELAGSFPEPHDIHALCHDMTRCFLSLPPSPREEAMLYGTLLSGGVDYEWSLDDPAQQPAERIRRFLRALMGLPKFQLY